MADERWNKISIDRTSEHGEDEVRLAQITAELVRQGVVFRVTDTPSTYEIVFSGGY